MPKRTYISTKTHGNCEICHAAFIGRSDKRFCKTCARDRERETDRIRANQKLRDAGVRQVGSTIICEMCGKPDTLRGGKQKYCAPCRKPYDAAWKRNRRKIDPQFHLTDRIRRAINGSLAKGVKRRRSWETLVGYTTADLFRHIERQFAKGMTWDNRDRWHIDHVVPLRSFTFTDPADAEFRAAWALSNLRPLWKPENEHKQGRRFHLL